MRRALTFALVGVCYLLRVAAAEAQPALPPSATVAPSEAVPRSAAVPPTPDQLAGFDLLASVGYADATGKILGLELQPYGASFGLDFGYTFRPGFRVGGVVGYGLGRTVQQRHRSVVGDDFDFTA